MSKFISRNVRARHKQLNKSLIHFPQLNSTKSLPSALSTFPQTSLPLLPILRLSSNLLAASAIRTWIPELTFPLSNCPIGNLLWCGYPCKRPLSILGHVMLNTPFLAPSFGELLLSPECLDCLSLIDITSGLFISHAYGVRHVVHGVPVLPHSLLHHAFSIISHSITSVN